MLINLDSSAVFLACHPSCIPMAYVVVNVSLNCFAVFNVTFVLGYIVSLAYSVDCTDTYTSDVCQVCQLTLDENVVTLLLLEGHEVQNSGV